MKYAKTIGTALLLASLLAACGGSGGGGSAPPPAPGSLDLSFGGTGIVTTALGSGNEDITAVAIQSDGKIVVAGYSNIGPGNNDFALARYNPDGTLDTTFGTDGIVTTPMGAANDYATAVAIQSDGKIVVAGVSNNGTDNDFALVRYRANGSVDTMGLCFPLPCTPPPAIVTTSIGSGTDQAFALAIQGDGKIVVAGRSINSSGNYDFALVRYSDELFGITLDATFGTGGIVTTPVGSGNDEAFALAIQSDSKIVVAGVSLNSSGNNDFALVRYTPGGTLDTSFAGYTICLPDPIGCIDLGGKSTFDFGGDDRANALAIESDGKIVVAGYSSNGSNNDFALARYNPDGSLSTTFDTDGIVTTPIGSANDQAYALAIQSDGKIIVAGDSMNSSLYNDFALARYNTNGSLDTAFDTDGKITTAIDAEGGSAYAMAIDADGKIVVVGSSWNGSNRDFALARYWP